MAKNKESWVSTYTRRVIKGRFKRSEDVTLYPISFFFSMESFFLPIPIYTSNRDYLTASAMRRRVSITARIIQIVFYSSIVYVCMAIIKTGLGEPNIGIILLSLLALSIIFYLILSILLSLRYIQWLVKNFKSQWRNYKD